MTAPSIDPAEKVSDPSTEADLHADKYNDPRAKLSRRGVWMLVGVAILGVAGAVGSIYARRIQREQTTRFWGHDAMRVIELGERVKMLPKVGKEFKPVELTGTPGLGHLRRTFLEQRNFVWATESEQSVESAADAVEESAADAVAESYCVQLRFSDPTAARFSTFDIDVDLQGGWVGPSDGSRRVQVNGRVQSGLKSYLSTMMDVSQKRADLR